MKTKEVKVDESKYHIKYAVYRKRWWWPWWYLSHFRSDDKPQKPADNGTGGKKYGTPNWTKPTVRSDGVTRKLDPRSVRPVAPTPDRSYPAPRRDNSSDFLTGVVVGSLLGGGQSSSGSRSSSNSDDSSFSGGGGSFGGGGASGSWGDSGGSSSSYDTGSSSSSGSSGSDSSSSSSSDSGGGGGGGGD